MMFLKTVLEGIVPGHDVKLDGLQACHCFKKKDTVIVKFKCRKQKCSIFINRKNLQNKSDILTEHNFSGRLFHFGEYVSQEPPIILKIKTVEKCCQDSFHVVLE